MRGERFSVAIFVYIPNIGAVHGRARAPFATTSWRRGTTSRGECQDFADSEDVVEPITGVARWMSGG